MSTVTPPPASVPAAPVWTRPDVYTNLQQAFVRGGRNFHRLEHLGRNGAYTLSEETVTDLLVADMAGKSYDVWAACPACAAHVTCGHWTGAGKVPPRQLRVRTLTKIEEGGHSGQRKRGANADFVIAMAAFDPDSGREKAAAREVRLLVQAKRVSPGTSFLTRKEDRQQYRRLVQNAYRYRAAPYYALYVQQPDAHSSTATACHVHTQAADRAIVLVPASPVESSPSYLPGKPVTTVLALGRPLRCLAGCPCLQSGKASNVTAAAAAFVQADFPDYQPSRVGDSLPEDVVLVASNASQYKHPFEQLQWPQASRQRAAREAPEDLLVVRLGRQERVEDDDRYWTGFGPGMTDRELQDAARMYWRLDPKRAAALRYLVASRAGIAVAAYAVLPDGVSYIVDEDGNRRASLDVEPVDSDRLRTALLARANAALDKLRQGAANPVLYVN